MKKVLFIVVLLFTIIPIYSQSNQIVDQVLAQELIDFDKGVYLILSAGGVITQDRTPAEAMATLEGLNWHITVKKATDKMSLIDASMLIMNALELQGGIMYSLFPISRYAYKEMKFKGFIENATDGNRLISGVELLTILGKSLAYKEGGDNV